MADLRDVVTLNNGEESKGAQLAGKAQAFRRGRAMRAKVIVAEFYSSPWVFALARDLPKFGVAPKLEFLSWTSP